MKSKIIYFFLFFFFHHSPPAHGAHADGWLKMRRALVGISLPCLALAYQLAENDQIKTSIRHAFEPRKFLSIPAENFLRSFSVLLSHESGHGIAGRLCGIKNGSINLGGDRRNPPLLGAGHINVRGLDPAYGNWVGTSKAPLSKGNRIAIALAGPLMGLAGNFLSKLALGKSPFTTDKWDLLQAIHLIPWTLGNMQNDGYHVLQELFPAINDLSPDIFNSSLGITLLAAALAHTYQLRSQLKKANLSARDNVALFFLALFNCGAYGFFHIDLEVNKEISKRCICFFHK